MVQEAKEHEVADKQARDTVEKRNKLDSTILEIEKTLKEHRAQLADADAQRAQAACEKARAVLTEHPDDAAKLVQATEELVQESMKVAEILYKNKQETGESPNANNSSETPPPSRCKRCRRAA